MPVIVKRYRNRKLYDTQSKRYITLEGIEELIKDDQVIQVIDNQTGEDITAVTLGQIIFEIEKKRSGFLPIKLLISLVQSRGNRIEDIKQNIFNSLNLNHHYDVEIERRINLLVELGELNQVEGTQLLGKLLTVSNQSQRAKEYFGEKIFDYFIDQQIPTKNEFQALIRKIDSMSQRIDGLSLDEKSKL